MTQILVDRAMRDKMLQSVEGAEFVDDTGAIVGSYIPPLPPSYNPRWRPPPMSDEEYQRCLAEPGIYTTAEVLEHLRSL